MRSERGDFNSCGKWSSGGVTFNAVVVVGVVSLLLFRLPMAILCMYNEFGLNEIILLVAYHDFSSLKRFIHL